MKPQERSPKDLPLVFITNVCVIFNCIQVLISNVPQTHLINLVLKIYYRNEYNH